MRYLSLSQLTKDIRRPSFWLILALLVLITLLHYGQALGFSVFHAQIIADFGLDRHAFERILYLAPIVLAGFVFSWRGAFVTSLIALACMLPRAIFISPHPIDALLETGAVFIVGNALAISFASLRKEREYRARLEVTQQELQAQLQVIAENEKRLATLHQMAIRAQEEERKRIARAIHDESVQSLASLAHKIEAITTEKWRLPKDVIHYLEGLCSETKGIMDGLRRFSHGLRPGVLDQIGLGSALELLAEELSKEQNVSASLEISGSERRLEPEIEVTLFRIAQEALSNVRRHSGAKKAAIKLQFTSRKVKLTVSDDGRGFQLPEVLGDLATEGKLGLVGMQERTRLLNGKFSIKSIVGKGTKVVVEVSD